MQLLFCVPIKKIGGIIIRNLNKVEINVGFYLRKFTYVTP
jgi:hypothetical protein